MKANEKLLIAFFLLISSVISAQEPNNKPLIPADNNMEYWISRSREVNGNSGKIADDF